ncbi:fibronectin type III domain-containing protein [Neobacillus drentensis]|uniref:fibronectin type III domain-containing protein n=1 Tax=Neobacillus drentensis TaxID=220684 RepID=UPI00285D414A|nr:cytochrome c3 family protein [Neobacillus drentensis]MDR7237734.1 putative CXXCH cytochrome family protein [Neobacillus drentensis]
MSKGKLGLSFLTAFALMLVFSMVAMAATAGVVNLKATVDNAGVLKATWSADTATGVTGYTVTVKKASDSTVVDTQTIATTSYTFNVDSNTIYNVEIKTNGGVNDTMTSTLSGVKYRYNNLTTSTDKDNALDNANHTGKNVTTNDGSKVGDVIKSKGMVKNDGTTGNHRTHGEYQNNTNSCASCHQTHTGASKSLLFKDGVYNTCTACHDGTLGFYNVFEPSNAGTFGGTHQGNMSVHLADGSVQIKAAPGGNGAANTGSWVNEFNCASCHSPHGSYSDRLLHYNPNGMGLAKKADGGIGIKGGTVYSFGSLPTTASVTDSNFIAVKGKASDFGLVAADIDGAVPADTTVITVFEKSGTSWVKSSNPWLYGYVYGSPKNYYTRFYKDFGTDVDGQMKAVDDGKGGKDYVYIADFHDNELGNSEINFGKGFIYSKTTYLDDVKTADVGRAYTVDLDLQEIARFGSVATGVPIFKSNVNSLFDGTKAGAGVQMSNYCAACHTDYLAKSGSATGTFSQAYRHTTNSDSYTCVRCHYAHGTDVTVMMDSHGEKIADLTKVGGAFEGNTAKATDYLLDKNPSSALKRYTNMSVCWGCHTDSKAEQLKNTSSYKDDNDPHGLEAQPVVETPVNTTNGEMNQ